MSAGELGHRVRMDECGANFSPPVKQVNVTEVRKQSESGERKWREKVERESGERKWRVKVERARAREREGCSAVANNNVVSVTFKLRYRSM